MKGTLLFAMLLLSISLPGREENERAIAPLAEDRVLAPDMERMARLVREGAFAEILRAGMA